MLQPAGENNFTKSVSLLEDVGCLVERGSISLHHHVVHAVAVLVYLLVSLLLVVLRGQRRVRRGLALGLHGCVCLLCLLELDLEDVFGQCGHEGSGQLLLRRLGEVDVLEVLAEKAEGQSGPGLSLLVQLSGDLRQTIQLQQMRSRGR